MEKVYLQKTQFTINDDKIYKGQILFDKPEKFIESMKHFEDRRVYKVLVKDNEQFLPIKTLFGTPFAQKISNYLNGSYQNEDFLVYIVS